LPNPWLPIIDQRFSKEPFLETNPLEIIKNGKYNKMPIMIGQTRNEGIIRASRYLKSSDSLRRLDLHWLDVANMLLFNKSADEINDKDLGVVTKVRDFYFSKNPNSGTTEFNRDNLDQLVEMLGDCYTFGPLEQFSHLVLHTSAQPVYAYSFDYLGQGYRRGDRFTFSVVKRFIQNLLRHIGIKMGAGDSQGVCHGDEMVYFFPSSKSSRLTQMDKEVSKKVVSLWLNFVHSSNPTPSPDGESPLGKLTWAPRNKDQAQYLVIGSALEMRTFDEDMQARSQFWRKMLQDEIQSKKSSQKPPAELHKKLFFQRQD